MAVEFSELIELFFLFLMFASLIVTSELKKLYHIAITFIIFMSATAGIFWILGAPILSIFQLTIYAGTTGVMLFAALSLFSEEEEGVE